MLNLSRAQSRRPLTSLAVAVAAVLPLIAVGTFGIQAAHADPVTLSVYGTSDVSDSGLMANVIMPRFAAAQSGYVIKYTGEGTGKAIADAEAGNAAVLIVHAPSLENQFVAGGYSLNNDYGRAIFWGDYILAGATTDPAGIVAKGDENNIVKSYADVAAAGAAGNATFESRSGLPGTTVQEHQIWAQVAALNEVPSGVILCQVSTANGGGMTPSSTGAEGDACQSTVTPPSWYVVNSATQAANIHDADVCAQSTTGVNDCYVFTDRGTYDNVQGGTNATEPAANNLKLITENDTKSAEDPTGTLLVNTFHAYAVNPAAVSSNAATNPAGATALLNYLTSPAAQTAIGQYQISDTSGLPDFRPDAVPTVTTSALPAVIDPSKDTTVTGTVKNVVPGTSALSGVLVTLMGQVTATPSAAPTVVATTTTKSDGSFSLSFSTVVERSYTLTTPALDGVLEYSAIHPPFADQLQATSTDLGAPPVQGEFRTVTASGKGKAITVSGSVIPKVRGTAAVLRLFAKVAGAGHTYHDIRDLTLADGQKSFKFAVAQSPRTYQYYLRYVNTGYIQTGSSAVQSVTVVS